MPHKTAQEWDQAFAEAFSKYDADALLALYEPGAVWVTEPGQSVQGHAAIAEAAAASFAIQPTIKLTTKGVLDSGDIVASTQAGRSPPPATTAAHWKWPATRPSSCAARPMAPS